MDINIIIEIEELLNGQKMRSHADRFIGTAGKYNSRIFDLINNSMEENTKSDTEPGTTIYEDVIAYIKEQKQVPFIRKNGEVKEATFYQYAHIDKSTWSDMKWKKTKIMKKTLQKLAFGLNFNRSQAEALLEKGREQFDQNDIQDKIILAIIEVRKTHPLEIEDIIEIIAEYQEMYKDTNPFDSIYDTPEMIAERKKKENKHGNSSVGDRMK